LEKDLNIANGQIKVLETDAELLQEKLRTVRDEVSGNYETVLEYERNFSVELKKEKDKLSEQLSKVQQRNKELEEQLFSQSASDQANNSESLPVYKEGGEEASSNPPVYDDYAELQNYVNEAQEEANKYYKQVNDLQHQISNLNEELTRAQTAQQIAENQVANAQAELASAKESISELENRNKELRDRPTDVFLKTTIEE